MGDVPGAMQTEGAVISEAAWYEIRLSGGHVMETEDVFCVEFTENGSLGVLFSEHFLSSSLEEQIQALEAFFWKKTLEPSSAQEVNLEMTRHEVTIILAEVILAKLKSGERLERDTQLDLSFDEIMSSDLLRTC